LEPISDVSAKKLPLNSKLPPVNFKRTPMVARENRIPDESPEEMRMVNKSNDMENIEPE